MAASQRTRFFTAMVALVGERGYDSVTVRDLVAVAKVSSRAFYEHFSGKEDCFLCTHELIVRRVAKRIVAAQAGERDWQERLRLAFRAFAREVERDPAAARLALVETHVVGPAGREHARRAERSFEAMLADSFDRAPDGLGAPPLAVEGIVAAIAEVTRRRVAEGAGVSPQLADELLEWALLCRAQAMAEPSADESLHVPSSKAAMGSRPSMAGRDLILAAVVKLLAGEEPDRLTVTRIRSAAGMSSQSFGAHFDGVDDCIAAAAKRGVDEALVRAARARTSGADPQTQATEAIYALCDAFAREPVLGKLCVADPRTSERIAAGIAELIWASPAPEDGSAPISVEATAALVWGIIRNRLCAGSLRGLLQLSPSLATLAATTAGAVAA